ncbi:MAG: hypothetical protein ACR2J8_15105 [Thermomicrobiales bacterium]
MPVNVPPYTATITAASTRITGNNADTCGVTMADQPPSCSPVNNCTYSRQPLTRMRPPRAWGGRNESRPDHV